MHHTLMFKLWIPVLVEGLKMGVVQWFYYINTTNGWIFSTYYNGWVRVRGLENTWNWENYDYSIVESISNGSVYMRSGFIHNSLLALWSNGLFLNYYVKFKMIHKIQTHVIYIPLHATFNSFCWIVFKYCFINLDDWF